MYSSSQSSDAACRLKISSILRATFASSVSRCSIVISRPSTSRVTFSNSPATKENRYDGMRSERSKRTTLPTSLLTVVASGAFDMATQPGGNISDNSKVALRSGWSNSGNAVRARSGTNRVYRYSGLRFSEVDPALKSISMTFRPLTSSSAGMTMCSLLKVQFERSPLTLTVPILSRSSRKSSCTGREPSPRSKRISATAAMSSSTPAGMSNVRS